MTSTAPAQLSFLTNSTACLKSCSDRTACRHDINRRTAAAAGDPGNGMRHCKGGYFTIPERPSAVREGSIVNTYPVAGRRENRMRLRPSPEHSEMLARHGKVLI